MQHVSTAKVTAATLGLAGFAVAALAGLAADNPPADVLVACIVAMFVCQLIGFGIGSAAEVIVRERLDKNAAARAAEAAQAAASAGSPAPVAPATRGEVAHR